MKSTDTGSGLGTLWACFNTTMDHCVFDVTVKEKEVKIEDVVIYMHRQGKS